MSVQMIELEEVQMMNVSDEALEAVVEGVVMFSSGYYTTPGFCGC